jgi:voltage-gated sodium channel
VIGFKRRGMVWGVVSRPDSGSTEKTPWFSPELLATKIFGVITYRLCLAFHAARLGVGCLHCPNIGLVTQISKIMRRIWRRGRMSMQVLEKIVHSRSFNALVIVVILLNGVVLGLLTINFPPGILTTLRVVDDLCLAIFCIELGLKIAVYRLHFFKDGWRIFDFAVVAIALLPATGSLSVLRALRVLRLMRLVTAIPSMRRVINGMFVALPGGASVAAVLFIMYYIGAIVGVTFFSETVPQHFGDLGITFFTLFKMMTLEGWPDIATVVMEQHPRAWIFFVVFIVFTTFTTLNLLFGIIVDAMEKAKESDVRELLAEQGIEVSEASSELRLAKIEENVSQIRAMLEEMAQKGN